MQKTRLIQFLKSLTLSEIKNFRDIVISPAFNKNELLVKLFDELVKFYPSFDNKYLTEEKIFSKLFQKEEYDYFKIKNLNSDLLALGKEFLAFNSYKKNIEKKDALLLWELRIRELDLIYEHTFKNAMNRLENKKVKDDIYLAHRIDLQTEKIDYYTQKKPNVHFNLMQEKLNLQIENYLLSLLKTYNIMLHEYNQNNVSYELKMLDEIMEYLKRNINDSNPTLLIYYHIIILLSEKNDKTFYNLNRLRNKFRKELSIYDNQMIFIHLDSYCATAYNLHCRTDLMRIQFNLAREYDQSSIPELGKVLYPNFLNEVKKAVRLNEFDFAESYIENYKELLTEEKENTLNFCYAFIAYGKKEYEKSLELFSKTNFSNFIIKIQVKLLLLQLYYEMNYFDQAVLMIDSVRKYVLKEKMLIESTRTSLLEFLKITGSLIKYKTEPATSSRSPALNSIEHNIMNLKNNQYGIKLWLIEKFIEFNQSKSQVI
ncbi:MAG: hypothetical protein WAT71_04115 [Ignavibacteria bacterium]